MDLLTFAIEALFALVFLWALGAWWRRREALSLDVVLVFSSMAALFALGLVGLFVGPPPPMVNGIAVVLLLGQPLSTLRLAARIRGIPRPVLVGATGGWLLTALPLAVAGSSPPIAVVLAAVVVFVAAEVAAAAYLAGAARRRAGAGAIRLWIAAAATGLFALGILAAGASTAGGSARDASSLVARGAVLAAALGYLVAFVPPEILRRAWQAQTAYRGLRELLAAADAETPDIWRRYLSIAQAATGASGALVIAGAPSAGRQVAMVVGLDPALVGESMTDLPAALPDGEVPLDELAALEGFARAADAAGAIGARFVGLIKLGPEVDAPTLVLLTGHHSLFGEEDRLLLAALGQQAAVLVEHRAALATQQRLSEQLRETVEALRAAGQAKSDFLASMSHELRTPLNAIIGFSDLMRDEPQADGAITVPAEWVEHISRSGQHLLGLINDVLDLSKVEAGRLDLHREPLDVTSAVAESIAGLRPLADRKGIRLDADIRPVTIRADRGRFRQILYNLLSNAIKYTPPGGSIAVESRLVADEVRLTVADTGVGISTDDLQHVFDEFRQVGDPVLRQAGTGLGLALTKRLVEAHGGRIEVESEPGVGSRFSVILAAAAEPASEPARRVVPAPPDSLGRGRDILVVEDDPSAARLLRAYLESDGYAVRLATDGEVGIAEARRQPPVAIVLDVLLPTLDGWDVLRLLKADDALRDVPVIMVTVVDEREVGLALGAVDYFLKPVARDALLSRLSRYTFTSKVKVGPVRVLAVDDDPAALTLLADVLGAEGFTVRGVPSGRAALELADREPFDLVVCDLLMPEVDGFAVVAGLRAAERTREVPILILTAHMVTDADKARLNGDILGIIAKGADAVSGLRGWLARVSPNGRDAA